MSDPTPYPDPNSIDAQVLALMNAEREKRGLELLLSHPCLVSSAQSHCDEMAARNRLDHFSADGRNWSDRMKESGYETANLTNTGENVGAGQKDPEQIVNDWLNSDGHRRAILHPIHHHAGSAVAHAEDKTPYWTTDFASSQPDIFMKFQGNS